MERLLTLMRDAITLLQVALLGLTEAVRRLELHKTQAWAFSPVRPHRKLMHVWDTSPTTAAPIILQTIIITTQAHSPGQVGLKTLLLGLALALLEPLRVIRQRLLITLPRRH